MAEATAVTPPSAAKPSRFSGLGQKILVPVLAVFTALVIGGFIILISGGNPLEAYRGLIEGAFGSPKAISETLIWSTPYIFAGLAVALAFKGGLFNIGAEGQLALGALAAAWLGYGLPKALGTTIPAIIHVPICVLGGALAGGLWGAIPGWLKARFGAHEVINTIMMNYIAFRLSEWLLTGPMKRPGSFNPVSPMIESSAWLPRLFGDPIRFHTGFFIALFMAWLVYWFLWKTKWGFSLRMVGSNPFASKYAGVNVPLSIILGMTFAGALAGMVVVIRRLHRSLKAVPAHPTGRDPGLASLFGNGNGAGNHPDSRRKKTFNYHKYYSDMMLQVSSGPIGLMPANGKSVARENNRQVWPRETVVNQAIVHANLELIANQTNLIEEQKRLLQEQTKLIEEKSKLIREKNEVLEKQAELFERDLL